MDLSRVSDWTTLLGATTELWQSGRRIAGGFVDAVTDDGEILWLQAPVQERKLYEKAELYEAWVREADLALLFRPQDPWCYKAESGEATDDTTGIGWA